MVYFDGCAPFPVVAVAGPRVRGCSWRGQLTILGGHYRQLGGQLSLSTIDIQIYLYDDRRHDESYPHPTKLIGRPLHPANLVAFEKVGCVAVPQPCPSPIQKHGRRRLLSSCLM